MQLSEKAIQDLKNTLIQKYGSAFDLSDEELGEVGLLLLTAVAEKLKMQVLNKKLST